MKNAIIMIVLSVLIGIVAYTALKLWLIEDQVRILNIQAKVSRVLAKRVESSETDNHAERRNMHADRELVTEQRDSAEREAVSRREAEQRAFAEREALSRREAEREAFSQRQTEQETFHPETEPEIVLEFEEQENVLAEEVRDEGSEEFQRIIDERNAYAAHEQDTYLAQQRLVEQEVVERQDSEDANIDASSEEDLPPLEETPIPPSDTKKPKRKPKKKS